MMNAIPVFVVLAVAIFAGLALALGWPKATRTWRFDEDSPLNRSQVVERRSQAVVQAVVETRLTFHSASGMAEAASDSGARQEAGGLFEARDATRDKNLKPTC